MRYITYNVITQYVIKGGDLMNKRKKVIIKLESYMKLKNISKQDLAKMWKKSDAYVYRRFSEEVEFSLTDISEIFSILELSREETIDIFFN